MRATFVRIVEDISVAGIQRGIGRVDAIDNQFNGERHGANENWQTTLALDQGLPGLGMVEAMAGVMSFRNDWIKCGPEERRIHLVRDLFKTPLENRKCHRIKIRHKLKDLSGKQGA